MYLKYQIAPEYFVDLAAFDSLVMFYFIVNKAIIKTLKKKLLL